MIPAILTARSLKFSAAQNSRTLFTPAQISTRFWLNSRDSATITATSGLVSQISDKSGNNFHATATGTARPTTGSQTINGQNALSFNGSSTGLNLAGVPFSGISASTGGTAVFIFQVNSDPPTAGSGPVLGDWGTSSVADVTPFGNGFIYDGFLSNARFLVGDPTTSLAQPTIISICSSTNNYQFYINGTLFFSTATNYAVGSSPKVGQSSSFFINGRIGEVVCVAGTGTNNRQILEGYLAGPTVGWNVQSILPSNHPYKSQEP